MPPSLLITCEHAGNEIPGDLAHLFRGQRRLLRSHRGWDIGGLGVAEALAGALAAPLILSRVSRLVIDLNRSLHHPRVFSPITRALPDEQRAELVCRCYRPHREAVERLIAESTARRRPVIHIAVHTFTPVLDERVRQLEIGLLHDPARPRERGLCRAWQKSLAAAHPKLRVRLNQPYRGTSDGFTVHLRTRFSDELYAGIELEVNQRLLKDQRAQWRIGELVADAVRA